MNFQRFLEYKLEKYNFNTSTSTYPEFSLRYDKSNSEIDEEIDIMIYNFYNFIKEYNTSKVANVKTAKTNINVAKGRAKNLYSMGVKNVIELCVGPSLKTLEKYYDQYNIDVVGNDIEEKWKKYYPEGNWIIGDSLRIDYSNFDACVFAPPLSKGCTGKRCDSLSIDEVSPSYYDFIENENCKNIIVLVLPGKTLSTKKDKNQFYKLLSFLYKKGYSYIDIKKMKGVKNKITKYIDIYIKK